jgi:TPP-dependent pyruvate/acetoin dehydrogenase alpha subunit
MYRDNYSPGWAFFDLAMFGLTWFAGYSTGVNSTKQEYEDKQVRDGIKELREKLAEQNRLNEYEEKKVRDGIKELREKLAEQNRLNALARKST